MKYDSVRQIKYAHTILVFQISPKIYIARQSHTTPPFLLVRDVNYERKDIFKFYDCVRLIYNVVVNWHFVISKIK